MEYSALEERIRNSYRYLTKRQRPDEEDDCAQECLLNFHLNGSGQTVDQAVIDYLRKYVGGRKGLPGYEQRLNLKNAVEIPDTLAVEASDLDKLDTTFLSDRLLEIVERYIAGYDMREIGLGLGITESRVSQLLAGYTEKAPFISLLPRSIRKSVANHVL